MSVTVGAPIYDGQPHAATAEAIGVDGKTPVTGSFTFTYNGSSTPPTAAGTYPVIATFTSTDTNYGTATGSGTLVISPATPGVTVTVGAPFTTARPMLPPRPPSASTVRHR